jgi:hypothetical protein
MAVTCGFRSEKHIIVEPFIGLHEMHFTIARIPPMTIAVQAWRLCDSPRILGE